MKKTLIVIFIIAFASILFSTLFCEAAEKPSKINKSAKPEKAETQKVKRIDTMIAVFDLEATGVDKKIIRPLTESIRREIVMSGRYEVIDRGNMNKVLGEQKFQLSGCVSGECVVEAGQLLGVGKLITGSIGLIGKTYYLTLSIIDVQTGKIENSAEDECKCEVDDLIKSSKRLVKRLLGEKVAEKKTTSQPLTDSDIEMVFVKGGCFKMGDTFGDGESNEKPIHEVCVDSFYMGKYEVTQGQWKTIMGNNPSSYSSCGDNCPVESISWNNIQDFITKLNNKTGKNYRLPTEAEWEYAAKSGGKNEKYSGGNDINSVAWYDKNSGSKTHPVGQKAANGHGIYDMSGNVWEWVNDWYDEHYYSNSPMNNPKGPNSGSNRVLRGGGWGDNTWSSRSALRRGDVPVLRDYVGFRLAWTQ